MALPMARPWPHPKTGIFYLRQRVPQDVLLVARGQQLTLAIGKHATSVTIGEIVQASLRTTDRHVAKVRHAEADAALKRFWASIRSGPVSLTQREIVMLAGRAYRATVRALDDDRGRFIRQVVDTAEDVGQQLNGDITFEAARAEFVGLLEAQGTPAAWAQHDSPEEVPLALLEAGFGVQADALLQQHGMLVDKGSRVLLLREIYRAMREAAEHLTRNAKGDFRPDPAADRYPAYEPPKAKSGVIQERLTVKSLFDRWCDVRKSPTQNSRKRFASVFRSLSAFFEERDVSSLTNDDIYKWAEHRSEIDKVSERSINRNDIAAAKAVFSWAMTKAGGYSMKINPATNVKLEEGRKAISRERTFRNQEIIAILKTAFNCEPNLRHPKLAAARRWCPWIAAYTGARISELTALRYEDIRYEANIWVMDIYGLKDNKLRTVPVHEHLIQIGFINFVECSARGPLFYNQNRKRKGQGTTQAEIVSKDIARWLRKELSLDADVDPNHGWRHTFKTKGTGYHIPLPILDAIVGHAPGSVSRDYISPSIEDMFSAMGSFRKYDVTN